MISWALDQLEDESYAGWCLSFVEDAIEQSNGIEVFDWGNCGIVLDGGNVIHVLEKIIV